MQRCRWSTYCRLQANVKQLCGIIRRATRRSEKMDNAKTNDQQWNGVVPASFDVWTAWSQYVSVLGHTRDQSSYDSCWVFGSTEVFSVQGDIDTGNVMLKPRESEKPGAR